jgi:hypothetical protein
VQEKSEALRVLAQVASNQGVGSSDLTARAFNGGRRNLGLKDWNAMPVERARRHADER